MLVIFLSTNSKLNKVFDWLIDWLMTIFDNVLIQFTIAWLLQFSTIQSIVISIYDRYYNLRRLLLQFTTDIQGRSQYEANRGTCLSHLRFDPGSVLFKRSHHKDPE